MLLQNIHILKLSIFCKCPLLAIVNFNQCFNDFCSSTYRLWKKIELSIFLEISISFKIRFLIITKNWVRFARKWMKFHLISYKRIHFSQFDVTQAADSVRWFTLFLLKWLFSYFLSQNDYFSLKWAFFIGKINICCINCCIKLLICIKNNFLSTESRYLAFLGWNKQKYEFLFPSVLSLLCPAHDLPLSQIDPNP